METAFDSASAGCRMWPCDLATAGCQITTSSSLIACNWATSGCPIGRLAKKETFHLAQQLGESEVELAVKPQVSIRKSFAPQPFRQGFKDFFSVGGAVFAVLLVMKDTVADKPIACRYMLVDGSHRIFLKAAAYGLYVVNQIAYIHSQISQFSVKYFGQ